MKSTHLLTFCFCFYLAPIFAQEPVHPSLFFKLEELPAIKQNINNSAWMDQAYKALIAQADEMMEYDPHPNSYSKNQDTSYAFVVKDNWKKSGIIGRIVEKRVGTLGIAGYLSGDQKYFKRAIEVIIASALASDPEELESHLQQSDAGRGLAIGYDLLYPFMSEGERSIVKDEIEKIGEVLYSYKGIWSKPLPDVNSQNHTSVHYGALGLCALALGNKPTWQAKATDRIRAYISHFIDDTGYGTEGIDYTNYGLLGVVPYTVALQRNTGLDLIAEQPYMHLIPDQVIWKMLPWGSEVIAMNDNSNNLGSSAGLMYIISRFKLKEALWAWLQIEGEPGVGAFGGGRVSHRGDHRPSIGDGLSLPFVLLWGDGSLEPLRPTKLSHSFSSGRVFMRDSWTNTLSSHVSFTSGIDYHHAHNHSDENSFTFNALGEEFAIDPGRFPWNTRSHNAILINGIGQMRGYGRGKILDYRELGDAVYVKGDARQAFTPVPELANNKIDPDPSFIKLSTAQRQLLYVRGAQPYLLIVDDVQSEDNALNEYTWLLHTDVKNNLITDLKKNEAQIIGSKRGAICDVNLLWPKKKAVIQESDLKGIVITGVGKISNHDSFIDQHYKELNVSIKAINPHFVTLLTARESTAKAPKISVKGDAKRMEVCVKLENGVMDTIIITPDDIVLTRK